MYSEIFELQAQLLKSLAHPRRLEIIHLLREAELPVNDIHTMLDLPQANISQHLMLLRDAGVVTTRKEGKQIYYRLSHPQIIEACDVLREILIAKLKKQEQQLDVKLAGEILAKMSDFVPVTHDPVCQMRVSPKTAGFHLHYHSQDYYFCASGCLKKFQENPSKYEIKHD